MQIIQAGIINYRQSMVMLVITVMLYLVPGQVACAQARSTTSEAIPAKNIPSTKQSMSVPQSQPRKNNSTKFIKRQLVFSAKPSDLEIYNSHAFFAPLAPMEGTDIPAENKALAEALVAFRNRANTENISDLTAFLKCYGANISAGVESNIFAVGR